MSKLVHVNVIETRRKSKMMLELTDDEVVELTELLEQHRPRDVWSTPRHPLTPRVEQILQTLKHGPTETRVEEINR